MHPTAFPHKTKEKLISNQVLFSLLVKQNIRCALMNSDRAYVLENGVMTVEGGNEELLSNKSVKPVSLNP